jgi:hypothetical protein
VHNVSICLLFRAARLRIRRGVGNKGSKDRDKEMASEWKAMVHGLQ